MRSMGNRKINVTKNTLIAQIKINQELHVEEYEKAIVAYKEEALKQLSNLIVDVDSGIIGVELELVTPVNNSKNYDKIIEMFDWEVNDIVELTQDEFKEYVQDETYESNQARMSNTTYFVS